MSAEELPAATIRPGTEACRAEAGKAEGTKPDDKDNVVDADFEDVKEKEENKEDKEKSA